MVKGGTIGTVTNLDGEFSITLPADNETLIFSMVGMKTLEVNTRNRTSINVLLESDTKVLEQMVVTGYTIKKRQT